MDTPWPVQLADWRRRVAEMYAQLRDGGDDPAATARFRAARDELFATHPQSPLDEAARAAFRGLPYFPHRPELRVSAPLEPDPAPAALELPLSTGPAIRFDRVGWVTPTLAGTPVRLAVYWLDAYSGGLFLPFRDTLAGDRTYGGGRYLLDTAKGADLGVTATGELILDFNAAYQPSCSYSVRWSCPLAPPENHVPIPIPAGERLAWA